MAAGIGLDLSARTYPNGAKLHDAVQTPRLLKVLGHVRNPLSWKVEVGLPRVDGHLELRAWDALIYGLGERTGVELASRLTDLQATLRQFNAKRRDDQVDHFLLVVADTKRNRQILADFGDLLGLPRLRTANVFATLRAGLHPTSGYILV